MKCLFPQNKLLTSFLLSVSGLSLSSAALSQDSDSKYNLAGFASFVYAKAIDDDPSTDPNTGETHRGVNYGSITEDGEYRDFNKLGLRLDVDLGNKLSFATQAVMRGENDYDPDFDWIYLSYSINPNLKLSVGKTTIPLYMYSDYLDTSYAYQWIEPPHSVYGSGTVKSTEGVRVSWRTGLGGLWSSYLTVWGGDTNEPLAELDGAKLSVENGYGVAWEVEREWLTLRAVYFGGKTSFDEQTNQALVQKTIAGINQGLANNAPPLPPLNNTPALYSDLAWNNEKSQFLGFGIGMDFEHLFFNSEITKITIDGNNIAANEVNSWYAMIGTRLPAGWSISFTYAGDDDKANKKISENVARDNPSNPGAGPAVAAAVHSQQYYKNTTYTLGSRWNFHPKASLKMEYLTSKSEIGAAEEFNPKGFRLGVDMVF